MKNLKLMALIAVMGLTFGMGSSANAEVGYIDYQRVLESYPMAQQAVKEIDAKTLELQQYMLEQEKQYKNLTTPLQKQNFQSQVENTMRTKQEALMKMQREKEAQILNNIQAVAKSVMIAQKLDAILSDQVVFVGGVDVTDQVIQKLK
ncbi:MAG: OmpH family outer membrane protein [Cyanobacteria bacterium RUI128]|nr:OmpH family outer membrane protein [Cyanobacteria bacterium RUI128]